MMLHIRSLIHHKFGVNIILIFYYHYFHLFLHYLLAYYTGNRGDGVCYAPLKETFVEVWNTLYKNSSDALGINVTISSASNVEILSNCVTGPNITYNATSVCLPPLPASSTSPTDNPTKRPTKSPSSPTEKPGPTSTTPFFRRRASIYFSTITPIHFLLRT